MGYVIVPLEVSLSLMFVLAFCCGGFVHSVFRSSLPERIIPYILVDLLCPSEEVSSGFSFATILNPPPNLQHDFEGT